MTIKISLSVGTRYAPWPDGRPVRSDPLPDGRVRHTLEDGRAFTVSEPTYKLDYLSNWVGVEPGTTYSVNIAIAGLSATAGFFEVWNFDIGAVRNYAFRKTLRITDLRTGEIFTGEELEASLASQCS